MADNRPGLAFLLPTTVGGVNPIRSGSLSVVTQLFHNLILFATIPALVIGIIFEVFLGHRHDYTGHYAAGYGATFAAIMLWLRTIPAHVFTRRALIGVVPLCVICILAGAVAELTVFRIAKFDEIDFFNQSIGAVLAAICAMAYIHHEKPSESRFDHGLIVGIVFLGVGGCFAFA